LPAFLAHTPAVFQAGLHVQRVMAVGKPPRRTGIVAPLNLGCGCHGIAFLVRVYDVQFLDGYGVAKARSLMAYGNHDVMPHID
jgi:hypothetical protein